MTVYRRDDFAFPPARGRRGVEFHADGSFTELQIGRGDAPQNGPVGRWSESGRLLRATPTTQASGAMPGGAGMQAAGGSGSSGGGSGVVVAVTPDRLEIDWEE
ncbi:hypothetical protein [Kribbella sp. NPDC051718]|uniref:hypothetical protein n=1 Tax=Kribbella sp. NPDC051718 TaxID=3155168 RepID=UPI0034382EF3